MTRDHGNKKYPPSIASFRAKAANYRALAKMRKIEWNLTIEEAAEILQQDCHYCGAKPSNSYNVFERNRPRIWTWFSNPLDGAILYNGIDRVDNSKGYVQENCVACCTPCNTAKLQMSVQEFLDWVKRIAKHQGWLL